MIRKVFFKLSVSVQIDEGNRMTKFKIVFVLVIASIYLSCAKSDLESNRNGLAKFEPADGKVLVFIGQDNASVGGNDRFRDGYVDQVGVPAGVTHYFGLVNLTDDGLIPGLETEANWGSGPMCLKHYLESDPLKKCVIHLSVYMANNNEDSVAAGLRDHVIDRFIHFLKQYSDRPFLLRIGYEFDNPHNDYDPVNYKLAFRRVVDKLREAGISNFATVMSANRLYTSYAAWEAFYPGDGYVDWAGYSIWTDDHTQDEASDWQGYAYADQEDPGEGSLKFAREHDLPILISESGPRGYYLGKDDGSTVWNDWFVPYFEHVRKHSDQVRGIAYINADWDAQPMWDGWGDTRVQANDYILEKWSEEMKRPIFINGNEDVFFSMGFKHTE